MNKTLTFTRGCLDVTVGSRSVRFYQLSLAAVRALMTRGKADLPPGQQMDVMLSLLAQSANYQSQQITEDELAELLVPAHASQILSALSSLDSPAQEAPQDAGKAA
jgi:hypothetical protein